jgi:hypothetical protein
MYIEDYIAEAMSQASAWNVDEEIYMSVALDYARQLCSSNLEPSSDLPYFSPYEALRF